MGGGSTPLEARVRFIEPAAFTKVSVLGVEEQRGNVLADLVTAVDQRASLGDGYRVEARIERARRDDALQVPSGALLPTRERMVHFRDPRPRRFPTRGYGWPFQWYCDRS